MKRNRRASLRKIISNLNLLEYPGEKMQGIRFEPDFAGEKS